MVKKRKQPRVKRSTSQIQKEKRKRHLGVNPEVVRKMGWDPEKTLRQNYAALGLASDVNQAVKSPQVKPGKLTAELQSIKNMPKPEAYIPVSMSVKEQLTMSKLIAKYGHDCTKMSRDFKINQNQLTEPQLKKRLEIYLNLQSLGKEKDNDDDKRASHDESEQIEEEDDEEDEDEDDQDEEEEEQEMPAAKRGSAAKQDGRRRGTRASKQ